MTGTRAKVVIGSLLVHVLVGALLLAVDRPRAPAPRAPVTIEVVESSPPPPSPTVAPNLAGGSPPASAPGPKLAARAPRARRFDPSAQRSDADPRGAISFDQAGGDGAGGSGDGTGQGTGHGAGIGFGDGGSIAARTETLEPPPAPAPPKVSRARPARLIFPSRQREVEDAALFVMKVTVDRDGYVAGAHLVRGFGGRRDDVAQDQIWRFRYDPARDDDGNPIASTVEQRFLVQ